LLVVAGAAAAAQDTYPGRGGDIQITPYAHSGIQLEQAGKVVWVDPWSAADLSKAKMADLILITDDVGHHLDVKAIEKLRKPGAPVVIAANGQKQVPDGIVMKNGERRDAAGFRVEAVPAYDIKPGDPFHPKGEANGYVITIGGARVYVAGVTECVPEIRKLRDIDVAFFPMNVPLQRMEPPAAVECLRAFRPKVVYPYHYDQDWAARASKGEARGAATIRGLLQLMGELKADKIEVRLAEWYPQ
jgi:L-ascorbate metabolism protein UlaG (beta-lactamase superfamily)